MLREATPEEIERILDESYPLWGEGLTRANYGRYNAAQLKTPWGAAHLRRVVLTDGADVLASAKRYDLTATLDGRRAGMLGIGAVFTPPALRKRGHAAELIRQLMASAAADGAGLALLFSEVGAAYYERLGFRTVPRETREIAVAASRGAAAVLVRAGEERDARAIAEIHRRRAPNYRFALERSEPWIQYVVAKRRLLAALSTPGERSVEFFCVEEGARAVAYTLVVATSRGWSIEDAGDRDPSGARVGAALQVLIAREPSRPPPPIYMWLPPDLQSAPQLVPGERHPSRELMMMRPLDATIVAPLADHEVLYPHADVF